MHKYINTLGCKKSPEDKRDFITTAIIPQDIQLPPSFSWKDKIKYILDQDRFGTCVGFASAAIKNIHEYIDNDLPEHGLSPLYIYTLCKQRDGIPNIEGTYLRIALDVLLNLGDLPEKDLPYSILLNTGILPNITEQQISRAQKYKINSYARIPDGNLIALKQAILNSPVLMGILVTDSFMYPENNKFINQPNGTIYGGHAIVCVGYDDNLTYTFKNGKTYKGFLLIQNSWSKYYGDNGFVWMPYDLLNYKTDTSPFVYEMWSCIDDHSNKQVDKPKYYRCQVGAFKDKSNCQKLALELKSHGFAIYIVQVDGLWKIQCGAFGIRTNAEKLSQQLTNSGYKNWITYY